MPTPTYTNRDLRRFQSRPGGDEILSETLRTPEEMGFTDDYSGEEGEADRILGESREFLGRPSPVQVTPDIEAETLRRTEAPRTPMSLRALTEIGETASIPLGVAGMVPSPASPFLLGAAGALAAPQAIRQAVAPEEDESRLGGIGKTAALSLGPLLMARRAQQAATAVGRAGAPTGGRVFGAARGPSSAAPSGSDMMPAANPNQVLQTARDVADESGEPLSSALRGYGRASGTPRGSVQALQRLAGSGLVGRAGRLADEAEMTQAAQRVGLTPGATTGARTVPTSSNPYLEALPEGGLETVMPRSMRSLVGRPSHGDIQELRSLTPETAETTISLPTGAQARIQAILKALRSGGPIDPEF